jgi:hypothetical protein
VTADAQEPKADHRGPGEIPRSREALYALLFFVIIYLVFELVMALANVPRRIETLVNRAQYTVSYKARHVFFYYLTHPDPETGFMVSANLRQPICFNDVCANIETDELGFRNGPGDKEESSWVVIGDSFSWGYGVAMERSWPRLIERQLPGRLANFSIIAGFPAQFPVVVRRHAEFLAGRKVVLGLYANDYMDNADDRLDQYYDVKRLSVYDQEEPGFSDLVAMKNLSFAERTATANLIRTLREKTGGRQAMGRTENEIDRDWLESGGWERLDATFNTLLGQFRDLDVTVSVVLFPSRISASRELYVTKHGDDQAIATEEEYYALTRDFFEGQGVPVLDLTAAVRKAASKGEDLYFKLDPHFNDAGNALAAREITHFLTGLYLR